LEKVDFQGQENNFATKLDFSKLNPPLKELMPMYFNIEGKFRIGD